MKLMKELLESLRVAEKRDQDEFEVGDMVTIKNAKKYDSLASADEVPGVVDFIRPDGRVAVKVTTGDAQGQMNVHPKDLAKDLAEASQALQYHVVSKLDGRVLASYATKQEAEKNAHGNPVLAGDLETIGDVKFVREYQKTPATEAFGDPLTGYHIVYKNSGNVVHGTPSFEKQDDAQKYLMQKMFANHHLYKVVHTAKIGVVDSK
jgi:hypothetical protein